MNNRSSTCIHHWRIQYICIVAVWLLLISIQLCHISRYMYPSNITSHDADWVLIGGIRRFPRIKAATHLLQLIRIRLHILIIHSRRRHSISIRHSTWIIRNQIRRHSFWNSKLFHLFSYSLLISYLLLLLFHFPFIFLPLLLVNLCLQISFHLLLFHFSLLHHYLFLISTILQYVSISFKVQIHAVLDPAACFDFWKVLLCNTCIEIEISLTVGISCLIALIWRLVIALNIKGFIILNHLLGVVWLVILCILVWRQRRRLAILGHQFSWVANWLGVISCLILIWRW